MKHIGDFAKPLLVVAMKTLAAPIVFPIRAVCWICGREQGISVTVGTDGWITEQCQDGHVHEERVYDVNRPSSR